MSKTNKVSPLIFLAAASIALMFGVAGCKSNNTQDTSTQGQPAQTDQSQNGADNANLAPTDGSQASGGNQQPASQPAPQNYQQPASQPAQQQQAQQPVQQPAPAQNAQQQAAPEQQQQTYSDQNQNYSDNDTSSQDTTYNQPVIQAQQPPPPLPEYSQPECPGNGYLWTPGYWSYAPQGYYWVPGAWAQPPQVGFLWTPGYWGFVAGMYRYNYGFWGQHIGYYGGINYGFGYTGMGYQGGYWNNNRFYYNRSVNNVNINNVNVYNRTVINNTTINRVSYNGPGGITRRPTNAEMAGMREQRIPPMTTQLQHQQQAAQNRQQFASVNHGRPAIAAASQPIRESRPIAPVIPARTPAATRPGAPNGQPNRPQSQMRPTPQERPQQQTRPATQQRPAPEQRPQQQAKPAPQQRPAPQQKPQQAKPAAQQRPTQKPEEKK